MNAREWALLTFTILGQMSAGMLLVLLIVRSHAVSKLDAKQAAQLTNAPLYATLLIMVLALLASLFHLGKLSHVMGAVPNLGTSWLSREVVAAVVFVIALAVYAFLLWRKVGTESLQSAIGWVSALIGLFLVYCTGAVYLLPAQPAWNTLVTPVTFFVTALLLGALGAGAALMLNRAKAPKKNAAADGFIKTVLQWIAVSAIILLGIEFLVLPIYLAYLSVQGSAAMHTLNLLVNSYGVTLALRLLLVFAGAGVLAAYLYRNASMDGREKTLAALAYYAFALVLIGEILGRFLFYATHYRIGV